MEFETQNEIDLANLSSLVEEEFREFTEDALREKSSIVFKNTGSAIQANIISAKIFKGSSNVRIYADTMDGKIGNYPNDYYDELVNFIDKSQSRIQIVLKKIGDNKSQSLIYLLNQVKSGSGKVNIMIAGDNFNQKIEGLSLVLGETIFFMTGDNNKFRLQYNHENYASYFSFNNFAIPEVLNNLFDSNLSDCRFYEFPNE